jgi:hypothetical protein
MGLMRSAIGVVIIIICVSLIIFYSGENRGNSTINNPIGGIQNQQLPLDQNSVNVGVQINNQLPHNQNFPKELVDPCLAKRVEDACIIITPHSTEESTCRNIQGTLLCVPPQPPSQGR